MDEGARTTKRPVQTRCTRIGVGTHGWVERGRAAGYSRSRVALVVRIGKVSNLAGWWLAGVYTFRLPSLRVAGEGGVAKMNAGTARRKGEEKGRRRKREQPLFLRFVRGAPFAGSHYRSMDGCERGNGLRRPPLWTPPVLFHFSFAFMHHR